MALTDNGNGNSFVMPVSPLYGGGYGNGGFGLGGDWAWILLLLLIGGNGWGMGGFGGGMMWPMMMGGMYGADGFGLYPWLNNSQHISDGFRDQQLQASINSLQNSVTSGFGDVQLGIAGVNQNICQTGNGITAAINNGFSGAEIAANARQMANMQQLFGIQSAQQQGVCDTRAGIADLRYTVATEACADRAAVGDALQAVSMQGVNNTNALMTTIRDGIQSIKDDLCADRLEAERRENQNLRTQLSMAQLAASQVEQTAQLRASQATTANQLVSELRSCPIPSQPVYGNTPIFSCNNNGCGCGNNAFGFAA